MKTAEPVAFDTNVLVYADNPSSPHHSRASDMLTDAMSGRVRACLAPQVLAEYYGIITSRRRVPIPLTPAEALMRIERLLRSRKIQRVHPKRGTLGRCVRACAAAGVTGALIHDRMLAETLRDHGISKLLTHNVRDFSGIPGLTVENPFA